MNIIKPSSAESRIFIKISTISDCVGITSRSLPMPTTLGPVVKNPAQPRLLHAEPANHGKWTMISEWTTGRIGIYESETGKFIKYIQNLTTPTFTYSVEHGQHVPGA